MMEASDGAGSKTQRAQGHRRPIGIKPFGHQRHIPGSRSNVTPVSTTPPDGEASFKDGACCKPGDTTPPPELVAKTPKGQLKSPYQDFAKVAEDGHHQFIRPGCNECHGGTGGGGICPPLTQGVWFWGSDDDTLFRLVTLGTAGLQNGGYQRLGEGTVKGPMPAMGNLIQTSDDLWKIIAWIRSINPPPSPPPPTARVTTATDLDW
jgi:mono/diheme cytochrome c family protein